MVEIKFNDDSFEIDLHGLEELGAMKRKLVIPYANIDEVDENAEKVQRYLKVAGASLGVNNNLYGRFTTNYGLGFFVVKNRENAFAMHLKNETYKVVVLEVADKNEVIKTLKSHINK
ncbi:MAG: hypothetical protein BJBARM5_0375 [Candidatus Parvarchaeum acidophilus ARMAN-5]|jgi:hypothetical protein|uniref:Uncharacterized protein n=1 Tax=Candidatus Parvarchaeum acidophilus ARMAN-5 TaxID=662762 RepID=D6GV69_PARA5|nr:MAG: hypothetical protein BJBARM5_0375 [Candidatus Parvarchaeum acidophilus ARMAN-5]